MDELKKQKINEYHRNYEQTPKRQAYKKKYHQTEKFKKYQREWRRKPDRKIKNNEYQKLYKKTDTWKKWYEERKPTRNEKDKNKRATIKKIVIEHYSKGKNCCEGLDITGCKFNSGIPGKADIDVLTIDHINGGGNQHRKKIRYNIYEWLYYNKFPEMDIRILCGSCQIKDAHNKKYYGTKKFKPIKATL